MTKYQRVALAMIEAAAWLSARPESEYWKITVDVGAYDGVTISQYAYETGEYDYDTESYSVSAADNMAAIRKSIGGKWEKEVTDYSFTLTREVSDNLTLKLHVSREEACEPKVIGQETVEVKDYANCPTKTITRDIVEYDCKPILG